MLPALLRAETQGDFVTNCPACPAEAHCYGCRMWHETRHELEQWRSDALGFGERLIAERNKYRKALEWYADIKNYVDDDGTEIARKALGIPLRELGEY